MTAERPGRRAGRAGAAVGAVALSLGWLLAAPAGAAENLYVTIDQPSEGQRIERSTVTVEGRVDTALLSNVDRVRVIVTRGGAVVDDDNACAPCGQDASVPFSYTTTLASNGPYSVRVIASGFLIVSGIRVNDAVADRSFTVAVRPAAPTNLKAEKLADNKVRLTWAAVPSYPDLVGYVVYRGAPGAALKPIGTGLRPTETSYIDPQTAIAGGDFQYKVVAIREGAVPGDRSQWLVAESNLVSISVPAPAVPTSTTGISLPPGTGTPGGGTGDTGGAGSQTEAPGAASLDLGQFFDSAGSGIQFPAPSGPTSLQLPDTGFNTNLPFPDTTIGLTPPRQGARPSTFVGRGPTSNLSDDGGDSNRRALLVPVAAGSVLCVAALHLRWLSRQLAVPPLTPDAAGDLALADADIEAVLDPDPSPREPVGAGMGPGPSQR